MHTEAAADVAAAATAAAVPRTLLVLLRRRRRLLVPLEPGQVLLVEAPREALELRSRGEGGRAASVRVATLRPPLPPPLCLPGAPRGTAGACPAGSRRRRRACRRPASVMGMGKIWARVLPCASLPSPPSPPSPRRRPRPRGAAWAARGRQRASQMGCGARRAWAAPCRRARGCAPGCKGRGGDSEGGGDAVQVGRACMRQPAPAP